MEGPRILEAVSKTICFAAAKGRRVPCFMAAHVDRAIFAFPPTANWFGLEAGMELLQIQSAPVNRTTRVLHGVRTVEGQIHSSSSRVTRPASDAHQCRHTVPLTTTAATGTATWSVRNDEQSGLEVLLGDLIGQGT